MEDEQRALDYEYRKQRYEAYIKEREALLNDSLQVSDRYDKAVLTLGGGALALSVTFLEKIAPHPTPWTFSVLALSWACLIASVLFELFALSTSQTAINESIEGLQEQYAEYLRSLGVEEDGDKERRPEGKIPNPQRFAKRTRLWNTISIWLLTGGIGMLCLFSVLNLPWSKNMSESKPLNESRGSFVPPSNALPPPPPPPPAPPAAPER